MPSDSTRIISGSFPINKFPQIKNGNNPNTAQIKEEAAKQREVKKNEAKQTATYQVYHFQSTITDKEPDEYNNCEYQYHLVWELINEQYYDKTFNNQNWDDWKDAFKGKLNSSKDVEQAISIMLSSLGDNYTYLKSKEGLEKALTSNEEKSVHSTTLSGNIGYIRIKRMTTETSYDFSNHLIKSLNKNGLIIDLRDNPGGIQESAYSISESLLQNNTIEGYKVTNRDSVEEIKTRHAGLPCKGPIIILINNKTASAAEILTAILHGNNKAVLVGERTFGKNTTQYFSDYPTFFIRHSVSKYLTPEHSDIEGFGIIPDLEVKVEDNINGPWFNNTTEIGNHGNDKQLNTAIKLLQEMVSP